jgi:hypothetical protein
MRTWSYMQEDLMIVPIIFFKEGKSVQGSIKALDD